MNDRIKKYFENRKKEASVQPISLDLSRVLEVNNLKMFATKKDVGAELISLTSDYSKKIDDIKKDIKLSDSQIIGNIERLNISLSGSIKNLSEKAKKDNVELSDLFQKQINSITQQLDSRIDLSVNSVQEVTDVTNKQITELTDIVAMLDNRFKKLVIPKGVVFKAGDNIVIKKKEGKDEVEYTISSSVKDRVTVISGNGGVGVQQLIAGSNISLSPVDGKGTVTITSTAVGASSAGSTFYAGDGIDITGSTITNILPGISLQAGDNITIQGLTISAVISGSTINAGFGIDITGKTVSNILGFIGTGGVSITQSGNTFTFFGLSTKLNTNDLTEGNSALFYSIDRWNEGLSAFAAGTSSAPDVVTGTGGVSVSVVGLTTTIYGASTALDQTTLGLSRFGEKSYNSLADLPDLSVYAKGASLISLTGTGGVSVSRNGVTYTIFGLSTAVNSNNIIEGASALFYSNQRFTTDFGTKTTNDLASGTSNFYYDPRNYVGTGGVSVSITGKTVTIFGLSSALNTNQVAEGVSNFYYTEARFTTSFGTKNTNDLSQGTSNFYYNPLTFVGSNGSSVSVVGKTVTIYSAVPGAPTIYGGFGIAVDGSTISSVLGFMGTGGVSVSLTGNTYTFYGNSTALDQTTLGLSNFGEKSYNSLANTPDLSVYILGTSVIGQYVLGTSFHQAVQVVDSSTIDFGISTNQAITASVIQSALGLSNFGEKSYDSLTEKLGFVGTGGVSISVTGSTFTIFGLSSALNTNQVSEGVSNFYYRGDRLSVGTGLSIFRNGVTVQIGLNISGISAHSLSGVGTYESKLQSKSFYMEGVTTTDLIPFYRVEQSVVLTKTVYDVSGGTNWVGQVQRWNNALGASKYDTQAADTGTTANAIVTSYSGASYLSGEYMAIKGASIAGGVSWLLINVYYREN